MIIFNDQKGTTIFGGGRNLIIGYTYSDDNYGAQLVLSFAGSAKLRQKYKGSWNELKIVVPQ